MTVEQGRDTQIEEDLLEAGVTDVLDLTLDYLPLSVRLHNCLSNEGVRTLRDILTRPSGTWMCVPNLGRKSVLELREVVAYYGHALDALAPKPPAPTIAELRARLNPLVDERTRAIWDDRQAGTTYRAIGAKHGICGSRVAQILHKVERRRARLAQFDALHGGGAEV